MRKLILLVAIVAVVLVATVPAIAQVSQEFSQDDVQSGDVQPKVRITNSGDNANLCPTVLQNANSGNVQNEQGVSQYLTTVDDIEFEGSNITMSAASTGACTQTIDQSSAASG